LTSKSLYLLEKRVIDQISKASDRTSQLQSKRCRFMDDHIALSSVNADLPMDPSTHVYALPSVVDEADNF